MNNPLYDRIGAGYDTPRKADPEICRRLYNRSLQWRARKKSSMASKGWNRTSGDGTFRTKALKYGSDLGDYMFVIAEKPETAG
ncbi:hypothetical protein PACILC2_13670 [Paenibacillus cisolokensis]|uniref:Uncharacterized protein n=1 Tax=Paenibacillus cisolokensis TaxID=1658519 RepID=A0ABQ4N3L7_9BACL|nr:hypothetical protein PACILC2_13670 [Paenibacillus cisolokensis]